MADCPHCKAVLPSEYLTQDDIKNRISTVAKARDEALAAAAASDNAAAKAKADADAARADAAKATGEATAAKAGAAAEIAKAIADTGKANARASRIEALAPIGIIQPAKVKGLSSAYDGYVAESADAAVPFDAWLRDIAPKDEFLAPHFAAPGKPAEPPPAAAAPAAPPPAGKPLPAGNVGVGNPPLDAGKLTPAQVSAKFDAGADDIRRKYPERKDRGLRDSEIAALKETLIKQTA